MNPIYVLLVEDSLADAVLIKESLLESKLHLNIDIVVDGEEATEYLLERLEDKRTLPDLIILDLNLPRKDGREVLKEIKAHEKLRVIPTVILTTSSNQEDIDFAYRHHANSYITKPIDLKQFMKIISLVNDFWFTVVRLPKK